MTAENRYIITDEMLQTWRKGCVNLSNPHTNDDICKKCEYRGKGMREKCCDFGDTDMEKIFRSHPANDFQSEQEKVLDEVRPEVLAFAKAMEATLKKHDDRGGWEDCGMYWLIARVEEELQEAKEKWDGKNFNGDYDSVSNELIDVANFCMMFWGNTQRYYHRELRQGKQEEHP